MFTLGLATLCASKKCAPSSGLLGEERRRMNQGFAVVTQTTIVTTNSSELFTFFARGSPTFINVDRDVGDQVPNGRFGYIDVVNT